MVLFRTWNKGDFKMKKFEKMDIVEQTSWCLKWFKITLTLVSIQAGFKIIETLILLNYI